MVARIAVMSISAVVVTSSGCAATSPEEHAEIVEEARACEDGDRCELAGAGTCTCAMPVNANAVAGVEEAAEDVECEGAVVECVSHQNLRCEDGRCRSDESP